MIKIQAFSLVELSIVLVILGLLTGGILTGQTLIRAAELRAVATEYQRYVSATQTFRDKYFALPGDMRNATDFWGAANATPATCVTATAANTATCNGNGDGIVALSAGSNEPYRFWQQLANAGLIEGTYTGIQGSAAANHSVRGENTPQSRFGLALWEARETFFTTSCCAFEHDFGNAFTFGGQTTGWAAGGVMTTEEAWNIDTKLDDGHASRGMIWAARWDDCTPAISDTDYQDYALDVDGLQCNLMFGNQF